MEEFTLLLLKLPGMQERFVNAGRFRAPCHAKTTLSPRFSRLLHISLARFASGG